MSLSGPTSRIVVTARLGFMALAVANVACAGIFAWAWLHGRQPVESVAVTGSATERIASDLIVWEGKVIARHADLQQAYRVLKEGVGKAQAYLTGNGVSPAQITVGSIGTSTLYERDTNGRDTARVAEYRLEQVVHITSKEVLKVAELSRRATELIEQGVLFESAAPEFFYTGIADLKIQMLARATADAKSRAEQICISSGSKLGVLRSARMGVMQITPAYSTEISDSGMNDTTSYEKDVRAVVTASFAVDR